MANTTNTTDKTNTTSKTNTAGRAGRTNGAAAASTAKATDANEARTANLPTVRITYVKSVIGYNQKQRDTIKSLGLRRLHQSVEHVATPEIRGMINRVSHLVRVEEVGA